MPHISRFHFALAGLSLCAAAARAQAPSPDARLAALYTEEWTWRLRELARTDQRPPFRRGASFSGYTEGWGLYTEWLGTVMGINETPSEGFGRLTYEPRRDSGARRGAAAGAGAADGPVHRGRRHEPVAQTAGLRGS